MRFFWSIVKVMAYAIDDFICWIFSPFSMIKEARDHLSPRMTQELEIIIFHMIGHGRFR